jgi:hypothetical protein
MATHLTASLHLRVWHRRRRPWESCSQPQARNRCRGVAARCRCRSSSRWAGSHRWSTRTAQWPAVPSTSTQLRTSRTGSRPRPRSHHTSRLSQLRLVRGCDRPLTHPPTHPRAAREQDNTAGGLIPVRGDCNVTLTDPRECPVQPPPPRRGSPPSSRRSARWDSPFTPAGEQRWRRATQARTRQLNGA